VKIGGRNLALPELSPRVRRVGKWAGYPLFGLVVFLSVLYAALPLDRIKDRLEIEAGTRGFDMQIGRMGSALPLGLKAQDVILRTKPTTPGEKPMRLAVDKVEVHPELLRLLFGRLAASFDVTALGGKVSGMVAPGTDVTAAVHMRDLDLSQVPNIESLTKLPIAGTLAADADVNMSKGKLGEMKGQVHISCTNCSVGDGKAKLVIPNDPFLAAGLTVPRIKLGTPEGRATIDKGVVKIASLEAHSSDVDLKVEGDIALRDPIDFSTTNLCVMYKLNPELLKREPKFQLLAQNADPNSKRPDGYYGLRVSGRLGSQPIPARCGTGGGTPVVPTSPAARPAGALNNSFHPPPAYRATPPRVPVAMPDMPPPQPLPMPTTVEPQPPVHVGAPVRGIPVPPTPPTEIETTTQDSN
jgi:type II secretion system protein N